MMTATFDVTGKDVDTIVAKAFKQADEFVGDREYTLLMIDVSPRVGTYSEWVDYIGEVKIEVTLNDDDFKV